MSATSTSENGERNRSTAYVLISRLLFPALCLLLVVLYIEETYGALAWRSLRYPYFVGALLTILTGSVVIQEVVTILRTDYTGTLTDDLKNIWDNWSRSIGVGVLMVVYVAIIELVGFIISSFVIMLAMMLLGGERNWKIMITITVVFLTIIYMLFVYGLNLVPPEGPLGI